MPKSIAKYMKRLKVQSTRNSKMTIGQMKGNAVEIIVDMTDDIIELDEAIRHYFMPVMEGGPADAGATTGQNKKTSRPHTLRE